MDIVPYPRPKVKRRKKTFFGKKIRGKAKITEFIRKRPSDDMIRRFIKLCVDFWDNLIDGFDDIYEYVAHTPDSKPYRNRTGGNLLFRPVALLPFIRAAVKVYIHQQKSFGEIFDMFPQQLLSINNVLWSNVLWNKDKNTMIMNHQKLVEQLLLYFWDRDILSQEDILGMKSDIKSIRLLMEMEDVDDLLGSVINP